ncbi:MAG: S46 family peptidase [Flavobacteriales bacterium]
MLKKWIIATLLAATIIPSSALKADEGMWLPLFLNRNYDEMKAMGLNLTPSQLYSINNSSLKDAIVNFGGFCTGEIISDQGLILTNHHCGYDAIQSHSTPENNILRDGFWAADHQSEKTNEGLFVEFLIRMDDVSKHILSHVNDDMSEEERQKAIAEAIEKQVSAVEEDGMYRVEIKEFFDGNEYYQFQYQRFEDVRLVGTPPESIGKYGGDTDNWMWPRQTGDFAMFRVYSAPDGSPAAYSPDNVPLAPKHHLPVSLKGVKPNDFAMIWGYPGGTDRYLSSWGIEQAIEKHNPTIVDIRRTKLDILDKHMAADPAVRLQYASKYANVSNYWKYFLGQTKGLKNLDVKAKKEAIEADFTNWVNADEARKAKYGEALDLIKKSYELSDPFVKAELYSREAALTASDVVLFALRSSFMFDKVLDENTKAEHLPMYKNALKESAEAHFKDYNKAADMEVFYKLMAKYDKDISDNDLKPEFFSKVKKGDFKAFAKKAYSKSIFVDESKFNAFLENPSEKALKKDPLFAVQKTVYELYQKIGAQVENANNTSAKGNRLFVDGLRKMNPSKFYYPNANFTMRCTYGTVGGYEPQDGAYYDYFTTLNGVMQKMDNDNPEFVVPDKLVELYKNKDYGQYADEDGELRVCFISNNDITGGNSGSPVINADGHLIGCAFDGNWEAMSGDIAFEDKLQRTISVDIRYVLFVIDKLSGAKHIVDEMTLVR